MHTLEALSPLDGRYSQKLEPLQSVCSEYGLIYFRLKVEIEWFKQLSQHPTISGLPELSQASLSYLNSLEENFNLNEAKQVKAIEAETNHDVKAVEYYLKEKFEHHTELRPLQEFIHFGCTSADINNVAYALMLKTLRETHCQPTMQALINQLKELAHQHAAQPMLSRTHGQPATPTTMGKELANFVYRLERQLKQFAEIELLGKFNGAVGNFNAHHVAYPEVNWRAISQQFINSLALSYNPYTAQIEPHDYIAEICQATQRFNTILLDLCRDIWSYISLNYFKQKQKTGETGSSTMPHKINPIDFENGEGNLGLANALLSHLSNKLPVSRWQRDLSDSTTLRNLGSAFAYALLAYQAISKGLKKIEINAEEINADLSSHWELLAEPIQTVMRRHGIKNPYEQLKSLTRGKAMTAQALHEFINSLALPQTAKDQLKNLTPLTYIGLAEQLAKEV